MLRPRGKHRAALASLAGLLLAFAFGAALGPSLWRRCEEAFAPAAGAAPPAAPPVAPGALKLLQVEIAPADWERIAAHRAKSLEDGMIRQDPDSQVEAVLRLGDEVASGRVRLKGDWVDHVDTDQWSLRFDLDRPLGGMRSFSIQHPKTRGFVMEWLVMKAARKLGVLAPRTDFVRAAVNGRDPQVYYLEEHASKQLLESQGRRDGPVVRFDESPMWGTLMQYDAHRTRKLPGEAMPATTFFRTTPSAYGEKHLRSQRALEERLQRALRMARDLQRRIFVEEQADGAAPPDGAAALLARQELLALEGAVVEEIFDVERTGRWLGLQAFFNGMHGLVWHQLRFYHDPITDRLEPLVFDTGAVLPMGNHELLFSSQEARWFTRSPAVLAQAYRTLGQMVEPSWLDAFVQELRSEPALREAARLTPGLEADQFLDVVLGMQAQLVRARCQPEFAAGFTANLLGVRDPGGDDPRIIEVEAWARTEVPTRLSGFRFGNGRELPAAPFVVGPCTTEADGGVLLPPRGGRLKLRFPADERLLSLGEVQAIKQAIRATLEPVERGDLKLEVRYRPVAESRDRVEPLPLGRDPDATRGRAGRPPRQTLAEALERHPFLRYDVLTDRLSVPAGEHSVASDLLLPERHSLHLDAGAQLAFAPGTVLVAGALRSRGTAERPVTLRAADLDRGFDGVLVLGTAGPSKLEHTTFEGATGIARGPWQVSGGVTFRASPVELFDCSVLDARGEDALNLVHLRFRMERCSFTAGPHDLFDGDFVDGAVVDCRFAEAGEDAVDVSGSVVEVRSCRFDAIGDKALSIGEGSRVVASDCRIERASIAIASKDRSHVDAQRIQVQSVENFVVAAYVKKPEFGPASCTLKELTYGQPGPAPHLAQTGCEVVVDSVTVEPRAVDVDALYEAGVLGK